LVERQLVLTNDLELVTFNDVSRSNAVILTVKYPVAVSGAVQHFGWMRNQNRVIIIIITDISKCTINDKSSQRRARRQSNQTTKSSVFSFRQNMSMVRAGSQSADVSEFQDVGPEDEKALGRNVTVLVLGTYSSLSPAERSRDRPATDSSGMQEHDKYSGARA